MKEFALILIFFLVIVFVFWMSAVNDTSNRDYIKNWAVNSGHRIESVDETWYWSDNGPWWFRDEHHRVYRVEIEDNRTFYFRFGDWFGPDIEEFNTNCLIQK